MLDQLSAINGLDFFSLQRDEGTEELESRPHSLVHNLSRELVTWEDTAGCIANLDLVITSCTSIAHLAGAMGIPTWIFCPINCYYIWATPGDRSPWYPSVRLFRQQKFGSWQEPHARIFSELTRLGASKEFARGQRKPLTT